MKLQGIDFGPCLDAAGTRGWQGEGYWYHTCLPFWLSMRGSTFVAKTATRDPRIPPNGGNMPIRWKWPWSPLEFFPRCIWFDPIQGRTLNSVGLSGPGLMELLWPQLWPWPDKPFQISIMAVGTGTAEDRIKEISEMVSIILNDRNGLMKKKWFGVQLNISCPNTHIDSKKLAQEAVGQLEAMRPLTRASIPIIIKVNVLVPIEVLCFIAQHDCCDAICVSNTLPYGELPDRVDWHSIFPKGSPIHRRNNAWGNGGYSGPELLSLVAEFITAAKKEGITKPWNAGGGIRSAKDVRRLVVEAELMRGQDSIFFGSAAMVRPWNVPGIIARAHELLG